MAKPKASSLYAELGSGTYYIPEVGLVVNGVLFDGNDNDAIAAYHAQDDLARAASAEVLAVRDAALAEAVAPAPEPNADLDTESATSTPAPQE